MISTPLTPVRNARQLEADAQRIAAALLDDALARLNASADPAKTVHETRKRIKELRALLRLLHPALVDQSSHPIRPRDNDRLRAAAGLLAEARDAEVVIQTLDALTKTYAGQHQSPDLTAVRRQLVRRREQAENPVAHFKDAAALLQSVRDGIPQWRIDTGTDENAWSAISPGLKRLYRRGRRAMHAALDATTTTTGTATTTTDTDTSEPGDPIPWHDWRRRAKDLRYALELLHPAAPAILTGAAEAAKQLTDHLGEDHDLAVLLEAARESGSLAPDDPAIACLDRMVGTRRTGLQAQAGTLGACLYAESPAAFTRRLRAYWRAASN